MLHIGGQAQLTMLVIAPMRKELQHFQQEKERVRAIIGKLGGVPKTRAKVINVLFIIAIILPVVLSVIVD